MITFLFSAKYFSAPKTTNLRIVVIMEAGTITEGEDSWANIPHVPSTTPPPCGDDCNQCSGSAKCPASGLAYFKDNCKCDG